VLPDNDEGNLIVKTVSRISGLTGMLLGSRGVYNPRKDTNEAPKPLQTARTERAIAYQPRGSRQQSLRSSQRTGKPSTGHEAQAKGDR
jgi:hypothetical protein